MVFQNDILAGASGAGGGYQIDQSIRFNFPDASYMYRTPGVVGNRKTWTWSSWVKFSVNTNYNVLFGTGGLDATANDFVLMFDYSTSKLAVYRQSQFLFRTSAQYRDPSAWYHIVWSLDTTSATADNRHRLYVNGSEVTSFSTAKVALTLNGDYQVNNTIAHGISRGGGSAGYSYSGYQSEINFIDGLALTPTDFGETNADGVWVPKAYEGTYGTNGFYITGADSAALGTDYSGNGNDFTSSGLTTDDQVTDSPTDNYAVLNPIDVGTTYKPTFSNGNLKYTAVTGTQNPARTSIAVSSGKWYFETTCNGRSYLPWVGIMSAVSNLGTGDNFQSYWGQPAAWGTLNSTGVGRVYSNGVLNTSYSTAFAVSDVVMVAFDVDAGKCWFGKNGTWNDSGNPAAGTSESAYFTYTDPVTVFLDGTYSGGADAWTLNFGQSGLTYTPPTGFTALSTANLPAPAIKDGSKYFQTTLYTGNGTAIGSGGNAVTQIGNSTFQPDFVWIKGRSGATSHYLFDAVRGATKYLSSDGTYFETTGVESLSTFDTDGFTLGNLAGVNTNAATYVAWMFKQLPGFFDIVSYTGDGLAGHTVAHALGVSPELALVKDLDVVNGWGVYHKGSGAGDILFLDSTSAATASATAWSATVPDASNLTIGANGTTNNSGNDYIAYLFAEVEGFSKFGKYTGNGSADGPMVYCGFRPRFVMVKRTNSTGNWFMYDTSRDPYNLTDSWLYADGAGAETTDTTRTMDILSNGFKWRRADADINASGGTYIYMAFAEHPFGGDGVAPATAR